MRDVHVYLFMTMCAPSFLYTLKGGWHFPVRDVKAGGAVATVLKGGFLLLCRNLLSAAAGRGEVPPAASGHDHQHGDGVGARSFVALPRCTREVSESIRCGGRGLFPGMF